MIGHCLGHMVKYGKVCSNWCSYAKYCGAAFTIFYHTPNGGQAGPLVSMVNGRSFQTSSTGRGCRWLCGHRGCSRYTPLLCGHRGCIRYTPVLCGHRGCIRYTRIHSNSNSSIKIHIFKYIFGGYSVITGHRETRDTKVVWNGVYSPIYGPVRIVFHRRFLEFHGAGQRTCARNVSSYLCS